MDTAAYAAWNPVFVAVEGDSVVGTSVLYTVRDPPGREMAREATVAAHRELRQRVGMPGIITFDHR
ncbi:MAG: hypothetical protein AAF460_17375 [Pseudomonadota bacterium]